MPNESHPSLREKMLADWHEAIKDTDALLRNPEAYTSVLTEQARQAQADGRIAAEDLRELLEWADSAYSWAVEELLNRELNR